MTTPLAQAAELARMTCTECGMLCDPREFHPFAACLMFKGCHDGNKVRSCLADLRALDAALAAQAVAVAEPEWGLTDDQHDALVRVKQALERIVSGQTVTTSDRLYDNNVRPRAMTIRDAKAVAEPMVTLVEKLLKSLASPPVQAPAEVAPTVGIELAVRWLEKRRDDYVQEFGSYDPGTGATEYGRGAKAQAREEYVAELDEVIEGIRALAVCDVPPAGWSCSRSKGHEGPCAATRNNGADE